MASESSAETKFSSSQQGRNLYPKPALGSLSVADGNLPGMERASGQAIPPVRTILIDDDITLRQLFRMLLESEPDFLVIAEAGSADAAVPMAAAERPDLIVS